MPTVTRLEVQKNNSRRYNVYLDEEFAFGTDEENLVKFGLHKGQELTEDEVDKIFEESELFKLYRRALDFLSYRPRSIKEVRDYLLKKITDYQLPTTDYEDQELVLRSITNRLQEVGYLNNKVFVEWWIRQRTESSKPRGFYYIRSELYEKGIDGKLFEQIWQEMKVDEEKLCSKAAQKRAGHHDLKDLKERKKLFDYLLRHGFNYEVVRSVVDDLAG